MTKHRCPPVKNPVWLGIGFGENDKRYRIETVLDESHITPTDECRVTYKVIDTNTDKETPFETFAQANDYIVGLSK